MVPTVQNPSLERVEEFDEYENEEFEPYVEEEKEGGIARQVQSQSQPQPQPLNVDESQSLNFLSTGLSDKL